MYHSSSKVNSSCTPLQGSYGERSCSDCQSPTKRRLLQRQIYGCTQAPPAALHHRRSMCAAEQSDVCTGGSRSHSAFMQVLTIVQTDVFSKTQDPQTLHVVLCWRYAALLNIRMCRILQSNMRTFDHFQSTTTIQVQLVVVQCIYRYSQQM